MGRDETRRNHEGSFRAQRDIYLGWLMVNIDTERNSWLTQDPCNGVFELCFNALACKREWKWKNLDREFLIRRYLIANRLVWRAFHRTIDTRACLSRALPQICAFAGARSICSTKGPRLITSLALRPFRWLRPSLFTHAIVRIYHKQSCQVIWTETGVSSRL